MKVSKLIEILQAQDQDADVSLYTGWEGASYLKASGVKHYPDGYVEHKANTVLIHTTNEPIKQGRRNAKKSQVAK